MKVKSYEDVEILWKDRKRWCGLPLSFTRYRIIRKPGKWLKLISDVGLLKSDVNEINLFRIEDLKVYQSLSNKFWGTGTVTVFSQDKSMPVLELKRIRDPYRVRNLLTELLEEDRASRHLVVGEMHGGGVSGGMSG